MSVDWYSTRAPRFDPTHQGTTRTKPAAIKPFTATAVKRLRRQLNLSRAEFAELLEVSPPTVTNWEKKRGKLNLQQRTLEALNKARLDL